MTVSAPPRPPVPDRDGAGIFDALIEEARRRARRRRRNAAAAVLVAAASVAAFVGFGQKGGGRSGPTASAGPPAGQNRREIAKGGSLVVVTMRGYVDASRTLHAAGALVRYREAARFRVVWRVPLSSLQRGRSFRSTFALVTGTTSATFGSDPARSCRGTLTVRRTPFALSVVHTGYDPLASSFASSDIGLRASPNPIATATSTSCARGLLAGRWKLASSRGKHGARPGIVAAKRRQQWWIYNHPAGGFYGSPFTPLPKGGDSEGWIQGWGPAGSFTWLAHFSIRRTTSGAQLSSYRHVLEQAYSPLPGLFLKAVDPCIYNQFAACRRADTTVRQAVKRLETAVKQTSVPRGLAKGDHELRHGLAALDAALALRIRFAHQATVGPFINADDDVINALNQLDKAAHDLNTSDPHLHLRAI